MSIQNAINFIHRVGSDDAYRKSMYKYCCKEEMLEGLKNDGTGFTLTEFEDAVNIQHVKCQTVEEANDLKQVELWFTLI